ncbi:MAG: hypothetical protein JHC87_06895, partial [Thermoleophilaceae bacterium]|nr:hypothetical protein [Thermoleophilaceae bacterium]
MAFGEYLGALADHADRLVVFGRLDERDRAGHHLVGKLDGRIEFVELPFYESVADLVSVMRARPEVRRRFLEHAHELDGVWIFGPHPVSLTLVAAALEASVPVCLGVRQDQPKYMRSRLTGWRRAVGVPLFLYWERRFRRLAKSLPTAVAGEELRQLYGGGPSVVATAFTLVRAGEVAAAPRVRDLANDDC